MNFGVLPDVNLLLALFVRGHEQHTVARRWHLNAGSPELFVCRLSQVGFLRLLTTAAIMRDDVLTNQQAWKLYDELVSNGVIHFAADTVHLDLVFRSLSDNERPSPKRWSDAYLAALALHSGFRLVTFDKALASYTPGSILLGF